MSYTHSQRAIKKIWASQPRIEVAGVDLKRVFGFHDFRSENPAEYKTGFHWHPHRCMDSRIFK